MSVAPRAAQETSSSSRDTAPFIDLILLAERDGRFAVQVEGARVAPLRLPVDRSVRAGQGAGAGLAPMVERLARTHFGVDVDYLGLLAAEPGAGRPGLVVCAVARGPQEPSGADPRVRVLSKPEIEARGDEVPHAPLFATALEWYESSLIADGLPARIQRAVGKSLLYLERHRSIEDGNWGWNLYMDGRSIGLLSTAEGILAHVHAGVTGDLLNKPVESLEAMQNPDGGWQVRRSLVGSHSDRSVTESTCAVLWALHGMGRSASDPVVSRGLGWLESLQRDGGWPSAAGEALTERSEAEVFPTTCAVRVLARYDRADAAKGVAWLRAAQNDDGGWGALAASAQRRQESSPAYTAYAVIALLTAGLTVGDPAVRDACDYLRSRFDPARSEPWEATAHTSLVDPATSARLDFRHFSTPWALAALAMAEDDLSDPVLVKGVDRLLRLQDSEGAWQCSLTPGSRVMWATHDALYALRAVLDATRDNVTPLILDARRSAEREQLERCVEEWLRERVSERPSARRTWVQTVWLVLLTLVVALVTLNQLGVFSELRASSISDKFWAGLATVVVTLIVAVLPPLAAEEYRRWRERRTRP